MFKFKIKADTGESHELTASSRDIVNWEKTTRGASMNQLKDLYKIAYFAAKRSGVWDGNEQSFVETYDLEVDAEQDDESQDPTQ
jgi:hypothetical protein